MNAINGLKIYGVWVEEPAQIKEAVEDHFKRIFLEPWNNRPCPTQLHLKQISLQDNFLLISPFTEEEIREAVWQCDGAKSPGPDGFNFNFIKSFWGKLRRPLFLIFMNFRRIESW